MYKDKDRQREANRERQRRYKAKHKGVTSEGVTNKVLSSLRRGNDIKTFADLPPDVQRTIERMSKDSEDKRKRTARAIHYQHLFPDRYYDRSPVTDDETVAVTGKPGDADYNGICTDEWKAERGR